MSNYQSATNRNQLPKFQLNDDQIQNFLHELEDFNKEFGYSKDPKAIQEQKYHKNNLYRELNDV